MAEQKIKVKVYGEWANLPELFAQLDELKKQNVNKKGKPIPLSKESQALEAEVRRKGVDIEKRRQSGASPADLATDTFNFLLEFKKLITSMLNITEKAKKELNDLETEVARLQIQQADKQKQLNETLSKGVLRESGVLEPTKKARQELVRGEKIKSRSGGRGEFYSTQDVEKLARIMQELLDRAAKIQADPKATETEKVKAGELKTDAARIADVITKLNTFETDLTKEYKILSAEIAKLNSTLSSKQAGVQATIEGSDAPEKDIDKLVMKQELNETGKKVSEELTDTLKEQADAQQDVNRNAEKSIEIDNQKRGSVSKLLTSFFGYQMALRALRKLWNDAIRTIQKLDGALTEQAIVSSLNRKEAWDLVKSYQALAKATGFTTTAIAEVATQYFRQGKTTREVMILTEAAAKSAKVAGIDAKQAVDYLTTALNGFQLAAEKAIAVSDKFAALAATSATSYEELAISLSKVAAQANLAGMSINYTLGLLAKGIETTREPAESIGTALKTIVARMRELTDYGATLEDGMNLNNVEKQLAYINIQLRGQDGQLRSTEEVLDELGKRWDTLTINQQASIAKALAGTRQQARLIAMMSDYERTLELVQTAEESAGATQAQQVEYMESLEASQKRLATAYEALITALVNNDAVKTIINFIAQVIERFAAALSSGDKSVTSITRQIGTWVSLLGVIVAMLVPLLVKTFNNVREIFAALKNTKAIEAEKLRLLTQQNLQRQYSLQLLQQEYLLGKQNLGTLTPTEKKQLIKINGQVIQTKKDLDASDTIAGAAATDEGIRLEKQRAGALKAQGVMMVIAGVAAAVSFITDAIKRIQNAAADAAAQTIEKNTKLQAEIYENTQIINSITKLTDSFETLDDKLVKTSKDWEEIENIRQQLLEQFKEEERQSMENMRIEELLVNADRRKTELEAKNIEKLSEMEENMKKASGTVDWLGNIGAAAGTGATIGAGIGMIVDAGSGGTTMGAGTLGGALVGGAIGMWTGIATSIAEKVEKSNAEKAIKEMLKTEEGLAQARYLYSQQLKNIITETGIQADKIRSLYEGLLQTLDAEELEAILLESGMTAQEYAKHMAEIMKQNYADISALTDSSTSYSDKIEALNNLLGSNMPEEMKDGLRAMYGQLLDLTTYFPNTIKYLDTFGWSLGQINDFLLVMKNQGLNPDQWMNTIGTILSGTGTAQDKLGALGGAMKGLSATAMSAIADLVLAGLTLQNVTETQAQTASQVKGIRDTQGKWEDMTAFERSSFISENMGLFQTDGKWDETKFQRFIQGMDITDMLDDYMLEERDRVLENYDTLLIGLGLELQAQQQALREASTEEDRAAVQEIINNLEGEIKATEYLAQEALNMFDMTLDEMIKKQQQQISLYRDMLEAERDALIKSLEERKDAYNDYFDAINKQYETQDYEEQKAKLEAQILKLSGATDAASMMKVAELQSQLLDLEKGRTETLRQDAQTAVLESIDTQIDDANKYYDKRLENDAAMLAEMGNQLEVNKAAYELQYWNYLQTLGLSEEAKQQKFKEFQTTFSGGVTGSSTPYIPNFSTPNPTSVDNRETNNNYSFNINGRAVEFTNNETKQLNELIRAALKRVGVNIGI